MFDFVISDTHFWHNNIVKFCFRPGYHENDPSLHNKIMADNWNNVVGYGDTILHLGDVAFFSKEGKTNEFGLDRLDQQDFFLGLPGKKTLMLGNHDREGREFYESCGFTVIDDFKYTRQDWEFVFTHFPIRTEDLGDDQINIHGHIHNNAIDGLTKRHKNVSAEVMSLSPQLLDEIMEGCLYRASEPQSRDYAPK
jgi:calcineurin-like phosphoesterase family protein